MKVPKTEAKLLAQVRARMHPAARLERGPGQPPIGGWPPYPSGWWAVVLGEVVLDPATRHQVAPWPRTLASGTVAEVCWQIEQHCQVEAAKKVAIAIVELLREEGVIPPRPAPAHADGKES